MTEKESLERLGHKLFEDDFLRNVKYFDKCRDVGEIDLYGYKEKKLWIVEYKYRVTKKSRAKALCQLERAEKYVVPTDMPYELALAYPFKNRLFNVEIIRGGKTLYTLIV